MNPHSIKSDPPSTGIEHPHYMLNDPPIYQEGDAYSKRAFWCRQLRRQSHEAFFANDEVRAGIETMYMITPNCLR